ncbi:dioxygenase, partial [Streptomyces sp. SID5606]|nr:dioxygenase [Streptomyces sp. SID5606]
MTSDTPAPAGPPGPDRPLSRKTLLRAAIAAGAAAPLLA